MDGEVEVVGAERVTIEKVHLEGGGGSRGQWG